MNLTGKRVLVTGATGFIGGRLVEKLVLSHGANVRCLVRSIRRASRIARFDVEIVQGDAADERTVEEAVAGTDVVFNCAFDFQEAKKPSGGTNAEVVENVCSSALQNGARLVHVSTCDVYGWPEEGTIDESSPRRLDFSPYARTKVAAEDIVLRYHWEEGLRAAIIQPTLVYGPYSGPWTTTPVKQLQEGAVVLVDGGVGACNLIYVDDVVDAMLLTATTDEAIGESFILSGPDAITWRQFYGHYEQVIGTNQTISKTSEELQTLLGSPRNGSGHTIRTGIANLASPLREPVKKLPGTVRAVRKVRSLLATSSLKDKDFSSTPQPAATKQKAATITRPGEGKIFLPDEARLKLCRSRARVSTDRAHMILGWAPAYDFVRGMKLTDHFIAWANLK